MLAVKDSGVKRQHMIETNVHPRLEFEIIKERKQTKKLTNTPNSVYHGPSQIKEESIECPCGFIKATRFGILLIWVKINFHHPTVREF